MSVWKHTDSLVSEGCVRFSFPPPVSPFSPLKRHWIQSWNVIDGIQKKISSHVEFFHDPLSALRTVELLYSTHRARFTSDRDRLFSYVNRSKFVPSDTSLPTPLSSRNSTVNNSTKIIAIDWKSTSTKNKKGRNSPNLHENPGTKEEENTRRRRSLREKLYYITGWTLLSTAPLTLT